LADIADSLPTKWLPVSHRFGTGEGSPPAKDQHRITTELRGELNVYV